MEAAGLAFGVIPVAVGILNSYKVVRHTLHSCRHFADEIEEIDARLKSARAYFNNEVQLLRRLAKGTPQVKSFGGDVDSALKASYESCLTTLNRTGKLLDEIQKELLAFESQGRLRTVPTLVLNEDRYERLLSRLRHRNHELTEFRQHIEALRRFCPPSTAIYVEHKPLPPQFVAVQHASRQLHTALIEAWYCSDTGEREHCAKLCVDAEMHDDVQLDIAISCQAPRGDSSDSQSLGQAQVWFYVQSTAVSATLSTSRYPVNYDSQSSRQTYGSRRVNQSNSATLTTNSPSMLSSPSNSKENSRTVPWTTSSLARLASIPMPLDFPETTRDLRQIGNICDTLRDCCVSKGKSPGPHCVGYLQSTGLYKHSLYLPDGIRIPDLGTKDSLSYSVEHALNQDVYNFISRVDQLQIARKLAIAVLQYNATPWLPDDWRLPDMSYLGSRSRMDSIGLRTLHLNSKITKRADTAQMEGINQARGAVTDQMREGITNPTLFHLGVAFLEIAYWCPIEAKIAECDENNPVITARRLQRDQSPPLGSKFHKITKQCLSCDFGFGDELSKRELQSAVYTSIVCGLEDLIMEFVEQGIE